MVTKFCGHLSIRKKKTLKKTTGFSAWDAMAGRPTGRDCHAGDAMDQDNRITDGSKNWKKHWGKRSETTLTKHSTDSLLTTWAERPLNRHLLSMKMCSVLVAKLLRFKASDTHAVFVPTLITAMPVNLTKITNMLSSKYADLNKPHHTFYASMRTRS